MHASANGYNIHIIITSFALKIKLTSRQASMNFHVFRPLTLLLSQISRDIQITKATSSKSHRARKDHTYIYIYIYITNRRHTVDFNESIRNLIATIFLSSLHKYSIFPIHFLCKFASIENSGLRCTRTHALALRAGSAFALCALLHSY